MLLGPEIGPQAKTEKVVPPGAETGDNHTSFVDQSLLAMKAMQGMDNKPEKTNLQKLMDKRRKETAPIKAMRF